MDFNDLIFPSPSFQEDISNYTSELIFIPKSSSKCRYIPTLLLPPIFRSENLIVYFHGNAEDIFSARSVAEEIRIKLNVYVLLVEYPGYSIYRDDKNSDTILEDSLAIYDYLTDKLAIESDNIYILGRSIGTGPSLYLASKRKVGGLVLFSPFTSLRAVAETMVGVLLKFLVAERFTNIDYIKNVNCPVLFIHGQKDTMIPLTHTMELKEACSCPYEVLLPQNMDHNIQNTKEDLLEPMLNFLTKHTDYTFEAREEYAIIVPPEIRLIPEEVAKEFNLSSNNSIRIVKGVKNYK